MALPQLIKIELPPELANNLLAMVMAGAKNPDTGQHGIMAGAQLIQIITQAAQEAEAAAKKPANGHAEQHVSH
jgi:hypothetical protein